MVRTRSRTRIIREGVRKEGSGPSNLKEEVRNKKHTPRFFAYMGIIGTEGSGRKTLAHRFDHTNRGTIRPEEVPIRYWYTTTLRGWYPPRRDEYGYRSYEIRLGTFIIPPPEELARLDPPLFWLLWDDYCCAVFAFDVTSLPSFHWTTLRLSQFRQAEPTFRFPYAFLVGNKSDRIGEIPENPEDRPVGGFTARMEAENLGVPYYEVSARNGINVTGLLFKIRNLAIRSLEL